MTTTQNSTRTGTAAQAETSNERLTRRLLQQLVGERNTLTLHKFIIDLCNGDHLKALLLEQLMYWSERSRSESGEVAKTDHEWHDELRLTGRQMRRIREWLTTHGLVDIQRKRSALYGGQPVYHYVLKWAALHKLATAEIGEELTKMSSSELPESASSELNEPSSSELNEPSSSEVDEPSSSFKTEPTTEPIKESVPNGTGADANAPRTDTPPVSTSDPKPDAVPDKPKRTRKPKPKPVPRGEYEQRDMVYEAAEEHVFGFKGTPDMPYEWNGRLGQIVRWLKGEVARVNRVDVGKISRPARPEHVIQFAKAYRKVHDNASLPRVPDKFVEHWRAWASSQRAKTPIILEEATPEEAAALVREYVS